MKKTSAFPLSLIFILIFLAVFPFMNFRLLRMAGDEKVYISTAIEMARNGFWFIQTLADEPNYFKGPFHYLFTRIGFLIFGQNLISGIWMNAFFMAFSSVAVFQLLKSRWNSGAALLTAIAVSLNVGIVAHSYASQMEVEVFLFYTLAMCSLGLVFKNDIQDSIQKKYLYLFWIFTGMAGWVKSPVHSVLIAISGLLYLFVAKRIFELIRLPLFWKASLIGIVVGVAGYLPIVFTDWSHFYSTYILREQFEKANNNRQWHYVVTPLLHFMLPWSFALLACVPHFLRRKSSFTILSKRSSDAEMIKLGLSFAIPTILFWCSWSYKGQNYNLPCIAALTLTCFATFRGDLPKWIFKASAVLGLIAFFSLVGLFTRFWPLPGWWKIGWVIISLASIFLFTICFWNAEKFITKAIGSVFFFIGFASVIAPLGEKEVKEIRVFIKDHPHYIYHYDNIDRSIWNEWGLFELTFHRQIFGIHKEDYYKDAIKPGHAIFALNPEVVSRIIERAKVLSPELQPQTQLFSRWLTKGKNEKGESRFREAWETRSFTPLEREFFLVWFETSSTN